MPRPPIGWRKYLRWRGGVDSRAERRRARAEIRFVDTVPARLSPGELHLACCPDTVIVDHDGIGPGPLLIQHHRQAHGLPVAWHTDTPANDAPAPDRPANGGSGVERRGLTRHRAGTSPPPRPGPAPNQGDPVIPPTCSCGNPLCPGCG